MGQPSSKDEMTVRHQFDRLCQMALKGEAVNYYKHMDYRRKHEVTFSELSEKELSKLFTMDEYGTENHHFEVHGYDIEVKNTLIAEALKELTERKRNVNDRMCRELGLYYDSNYNLVIKKDNSK